MSNLLDWKSPAPSAIGEVVRSVETGWIGIVVGESDDLLECLCYSTGQSELDDRQWFAPADLDRIGSCGCGGSLRCCTTEVFRCRQCGAYHNRPRFMGGM